MVDADRMVCWLCKLMENGDFSAGVGGSRKYGLSEEFSGHDLGTGKGKNDAAGFDNFNAFPVEFFISLDGIVQDVLMFGESWRVQDNQVVFIIRIFQESEGFLCEGFMAGVARKI